MLPSKSTILLFEVTMLLVLHPSGWMMASADENEQSETSESTSPTTESGSDAISTENATDVEGVLPNAGDYFTFWMYWKEIEYGHAEYNNCRWNAIQYTNGNFRFSALL